MAIFVFSNKHYNVYNKYIWKCTYGLQCWGLNPQSSEHEPPPKTTRPGLPPYQCLILQCIICNWMGSNLARMEYNKFCFWYLTRYGFWLKRPATIWLKKHWFQFQEKFENVHPNFFRNFLKPIPKPAATLPNDNIY